MKTLRGNDTKDVERECAVSLRCTLTLSGGLLFKWILLPTHPWGVIQVELRYLALPLTRFVFIAVLLSLLGHSGLAQTSVERSALNNFRKYKWEKGHAQLRKAIQKDTSNAVAKYGVSLYFFSPKNPAYNVDSAHYYALKTRASFRQTSAKQREKMKRFPLDSVIIFRLEGQIDSAAFEEAKRINTENAYLHYLNIFFQGSHKFQAMELRDEAAYLDALKQNTYQGFSIFLQRYPQAHQSAEAQKRYDMLLFESYTKDGKLKSYEAFLEEFPSTPYRAEVEKNIFEITTALGSKTVFEHYINKYPESAFVPMAKNILFHIRFENDRDEEMPPYLQSDSTKAVLELEQGYLVPFLKDGKFGFLDMHGKEVIQPYTEEIDDHYLCGNITEDVLLLEDKILSKNGKVIYQGEVDELDDLGYGFLKVFNSKGVTVLHKTGFIISTSSVEDAKLLNGKFIALKQNSRWSLWTLTGRKLVGYDWEDISCIRDVIVFRKQDRYKLLKASDAALLADQQPFKNQDFFDDVKPINQDYVWARTHAFEGILDQNLTSIIPFEKHFLTTLNGSIIGTMAYGKRLYDLKGNASGVFENIKSNEQWTVVQRAGSWRLINPKDYRYQSIAFDSINFLGPFAIGYKPDSVTVYLKLNRSYQFPKTRIEFLPGKDSIFYLLVEEGDKKSVFSTDGQKLFTINYDKVTFLGNGIFMVTKKEKKGLITSDGKLLLPLEYDAIGGLNNHVVSLLKNMKFGLFDVVQKTLIKPQFDKNLNRYNSKVLTGYKNGFYGFMDWDGKPITKFEFEEIVFWNDTTALIKKNFQWMLYHIAKQKALLSSVKEYKVITETTTEKIIIFHQDNNFGVFSNTRGEIIPINFTYIRNVGSVEVPMYFTEKHIEEASIYIVIYYDKNGELLRKQVYEEEDYEKMYCAE